MSSPSHNPGAPIRRSSTSPPDRYSFPFQSLSIVASTAFLLDGGNLIEAKKACTFLGLALSLSIWTQHFWNVCILVITYMILVHPLSSWTLLLERKVGLLWPIIWLLSLAINAIPWALAGFSYAGGYCFIGGGAGQVFQYLFPLVPRSLVVLIILTLYTRLFFFLRRTNLFGKTPTDRGRPSAGHHAGAEQSGRSHRSNSRAIISGIEAEGEDAPADSEGKSGKSESSESGRSGAKFYLPFLSQKSNRGGARPRRGSGSSSQVQSPSSATFLHGGHGSGVAPVWPVSPQGLNVPMEMREYTLDGQLMPRTPASTLPSPTTATASAPLLQEPMSPKTNHGATGTWNSGHESPAKISFHGEVTSENVSRVTPSNVGGDGAMGDLEESSAPEAPSMLAVNRPATLHRSQTAAPPSSRPESVTFSNTEMSRRVVSSSGTAKNAKHGGDDHDVNVDDDPDADEADDVIPDYNTWAGLTSKKPRHDTRDFKMVTPPREHLRQSRPSVGRTDTQQSVSGRSASGVNQQLREPGSVVSTGRRDSDVVIAMPHEAPQQQRQAAAYENAMADDWTWGMDVTAAAPKGNSSRPKSSRQSSALSWAQRRSSNRDADRRRSTLRVGTPGPHAHSGGLDETRGSTSSSTSSDGHGVDNLGSTLNRQASSLLLLYPLAYLLLFSISLVRLIRGLASPSHRGKNDALSNISRWLIFAQGLLDCIIFQVIERHFRSRMKRRRARARGEAVQATSSQKAWDWTKQTVTKFWPSRSDKEAQYFDPPSASNQRRASRPDKLDLKSGTGSGGPATT